MFVLALVFGCAGEEPEDSDSPLDAEWIGAWSQVTEAGQPATGTLTLEAASFEQESDFGTGICVWTGTVSDADDETFTITTETASGEAVCDQAIGGSASPTWEVSDEGDTLTLDYTDAGVPFGTIQVWERVP